VSNIERERSAQTYYFLKATLIRNARICQIHFGSKSDFERDAVAVVFVLSVTPLDLPEAALYKRGAFKAPELPAHPISGRNRVE
jgi:hypothetical protein